MAVGKRRLRIPDQKPQTRKKLWIVLGVLMLGSCQASGFSLGRLDPDAGPWALGFVTPYAMRGWVEYSATVDVDGNLYRRIGSGWAPGGRKNVPEAARGWAARGPGVGTYVRDAKLPVRIYVRWQSVVQPQTYQGWVEIPESARQIMRKALTLDCPSITEMGDIPKRALVRIGLAPGGIVQVWAIDECLRAVKVTRVQVEIEPKGPDLGLSGGSYFQSDDASKRYVEQYAIPYGSW